MSSADVPYFLAGGGVCGDLARSVDWSRTAVGSPMSWSMSLRTTVSTILHSRHPMFLWWGPELVQFYNDAYLPSFGRGKHPTAMGQRGRESWGEIWPLIEPQISGVLGQRAATWNENQLVPIFRNGRVEEVYWTYGYSPVHDDNGSVGGVLVVCTETTAQVVAQRRQGTLAALGHALERGLAPREDGAARVTTVLNAAARDIPFALISPGDGSTFVVGMDEGAANLLHAERAPASSSSRVVTLSVPIAADPWPEPITEILVLSIGGRPEQHATFGLSPRLPLDHAYRAFLDQVAQVFVSAAARAELDKARDRVMEVLESTQDSFFALDRDLRIALVNKNQERTSAVTRDDSVGRLFFDVFPVHRESKFWIEYHRAAEQRVPVSFEEYYPPLDLWTEVRGSPTADGGIAVFYRDISVRKRLETEREDLLTRERRSRLEAEQARVQAETANRLKDEFLAMVSHELRTPLNAVLGWATLLRGGALDAQRSARAIETIERNARAQTRLIEDLLDLSRMLQGQFRLAVGQVEFALVVQAAIDSLRLAADMKGVQVQSMVDGGTSVVGDPERLQQVVSNLLSNAIKFTPRGGHVHVSLSGEASHVELVVTDDGQGIAPDFLPHLFEPFRQSDGSITRRSGGLGLGLSIVRTLVELHDGTVSVESGGANRGARFVVRLPVGPSPVASDSERVDPGGRPSRPAVEGSDLAGLKILIVEDEKDARELVAFLLEQANAQVTAAASGVEAYASLAQERFDVIVSDIGMPEEDGLAFMRRVRQRSPSEGGRTPAIALTAYARSEDRVQALRAGFTTHLAKPVDATKLVLAVASLAGRRGGSQVTTSGADTAP